MRALAKEPNERPTASAFAAEFAAASGAHARQRTSARSGAAPDGDDGADLPTEIVPSTTESDSTTDES
jgi:hypothetical protein